MSLVFHLPPLTSLPCIWHTRHVRSRKKDADWHARQWGLMNRLSLVLVKQTEMFFRVRDPLFLIICLLQYRTFIYPACWGNGSFWFWNILFNREFTSPSLFCAWLFWVLTLYPASTMRLTTQETHCAQLLRRKPDRPVIPTGNFALILRVLGPLKKSAYSFLLLYLLLFREESEAETAQDDLLRNEITGIWATSPNNTPFSQMFEGLGNLNAESDIVTFGSILRWYAIVLYC